MPPLPPAREKSTPKRLTWNEQRELERMEETIHNAEAEVATLQTRVSDPQIASNHKQLHEAYEQLGAAQQKVEHLYTRWSELAAKQS